jgi:hypothetical protein
LDSSSEAGEGAQMTAPSIGSDSITQAGEGVAMTALSNGSSASEQN